MSKQVPVEIRFGWVPPRATAWVPRPRTIIIRKDTYLTAYLLAHELAHVMQWERHGWSFPLLYVWEWVKAGFVYSRIPFEVEARRASINEWYAGWATDLMGGM
jgi:hypothetical protein